MFSSTVRDRLFGTVIKYALALEPLAPPAISFYISRKLDGLQKQRRIGDFNTRTKRLGKFHYKVEVEMDVTGKQTMLMVNDLLKRLNKRGGE